jgi:hypothetical protein
MGQTKRTLTQTRSFFLRNVSYLDWSFNVEEDEGGRPYLQITFLGPDVDKPHAGAIQQKCRKWFLSPYMTETELVRTAYKAVEAAVIHEAQEEFRYKDRAIFSPHTSIESLLYIAEAPKDVRK